jgi:hypothetical protein
LAHIAPQNYKTGGNVNFKLSIIISCHHLIEYFALASDHAALIGDTRINSALQPARYPNVIRLGVNSMTYMK